MKNKNGWNLRDYEKTLKETSYDNDQCMTNSQIKVICFDDFVKEEYCPNRKLIGALSSNDALYCSEGKYVFIEFKNGKLIKRNNDEIISFGLEKFKGYCFKNVHTYSKEEFETKFVKRIENGV